MTPNNVAATEIDRPIFRMEPLASTEEPTRLTIIMNPCAGRGACGRRRNALEQELQKQLAEQSRELNWEILETHGPGEAIELARSAAERGVQLIAAAGGDGTLSEVANGIGLLPVKLGILPFGTGNDFARQVGLTPGDISGAVRTLLNGVKRQIDIGKSDRGLFLNIAACGFDAVVAERINQGFRMLGGTPAYIAAVLVSLFTFRAAGLRICLDGNWLEQRAMLCAVANARSYGGGMRVTPTAQVDDGLFDVCVVGEVSTFEFLKAFPRVFQGTHLSHPAVKLFRAQTVQIESEPTLPISLDGDLKGKTPVTFTLMPGSLTILTPKP